MDGSNASLLLTPMASRSHTNAASTDTTNRRHPDGTWGFASVQLPEECLLTVASPVGSEGISPTAYPHAATVPPTPSSFDINRVEEDDISKEPGGGGGPSSSLKSLLMQYDAAFSGLYPYLSRSQPSPLSYPLTHPTTSSNNNNNEQFTNHHSEAASASSRTTSSQQTTTLLPPWRPSMMMRSWNTLLVVMFLLSLTAALVLNEATAAQAVRRDTYYLQQAYLYARRRHFEPYYVASSSAAKSRNTLGGGILGAAVVVGGDDDDFPAMRDPTIQRYVGKRNMEDAKLFVKYVNAACSKYGDDDGGDGGGHGDDGGVGNGHSLPAYMSPLYPNKSVDGDHWAYFAFCFIAGILSALPSLAVTPVDIVKCRLQVGVYTEGFLRGMRDLCKEGLLDGLSAVHSFQSLLRVAAAAGGHNDGFGKGGAARSPSSGFHVEHSSREDGEEMVDEEGGQHRDIRPQSKWFVIRLADSLGRWLVRSLGVLFVTGPCDVQGFRNVLSNKFAILGRCLGTSSLSPPVVVSSNSQWFLPLRTVHFLLKITSSGPNTTTLRAALTDDTLHAILVGIRLMLLLQSFLLAVFAGWQPVCVGYSLQGSIKYGFYEFGKFKLGRILGDEFVIEHHLLIFLVSAMVAELSADLLLAPWESIKIRLQMAKRRFSFKVSFPVILHVEGIHELYRCLGPVMCRQVPVTSVKFVSYESIVRFFVERLNALDHLSEVQVALVAGCTAGVICAILTQPADTLVSQVSQLRASGGSDTSVLTLIKRLGVRKLYGGMVPRLVMVAMLTALQWGIYDGFKHFVGLPTTGSR